MIRGKTMTVPKHRLAEDKSDSNAAFMARIHNKFAIEVIDVNTGKVKQRAEAYNTVLDSWWDYPVTEIDDISYGRGTGSPSHSDTELFSKIGTKTATELGVDTSTRYDGYISASWSIQLTPEEANGETLTEVGLCKYRVSGSYRYTVLVTHAMLQDMNGNPISIKKTSTDIINIYGTVFLHFDTLGYQEESILLANADFLKMFMGASQSNSYLKVQVYSDANITRSSEGVSVDAYNWNKSTKTYKVALKRASVSALNLSGGLFVICLCNYSGIYGSSMYPYMYIRPRGMSKISGEPIGTGDGATVNFKTKFNFPVNLVVYVDGVAAQSGVSVFPDCTIPTTMHRHLLRLDSNSKKGCIFTSSLEGNTKNIAANTTALFEYLMRDVVPLLSLTFSGANATLMVSDDLETWVTLGTTGSTTTSKTIRIPEESGRKKYWKVVTGSAEANITAGQGKDLTGYAIRFDEPPANGSVITADYETPMIPKDENHIMDMSISFQLGEYTE